MKEPWVSVDLEGLGQLVEGRPKVQVLYELISNALDEATGEITIELEKVPGRPLARVAVEDDSPDGFADLRHAYTLFASSKKKVNPEQRGRFNLGEKLVLSLCRGRDAEIVTTTGGIRFNADGTRTSTRKRRERGSRFEGVIPMTREEYDEALEQVRWILVPEGVRLTVNGEVLPSRTPLRRFEATLPTVVADEGGVLRRTRRKANVEVYEPAVGERARIYEMGIPVTETGDRYHVNVLQKVPVPMDRDTVSPAYLRTIRTAVMNETHDLLDAEAARASWADQALRDPTLCEAAVRTLVDARFGKAAVAVDPSDPESVSFAVASNYTVVHGGMLDGEQWANVRRAGALPASSQLFPTMKPYSNEPDAPEVPVIPESEWSEGMAATVALVKRLAPRLMGIEIGVRIVRAPRNPFGACYGSRQLDFNFSRLGTAFFDEVVTDEGLERVLDLMLDEFAHKYERNHLSKKYHRALRTLGAKLAVLIYREPEVLDLRLTAAADVG